MSITSRLDEAQRDRKGLGFPLGVVYKYLDDGGGQLAALITYYGFLSLFPLLLLASTVLGIVLKGDPDAQKAVLNSALNQFPIIGKQLGDPGQISGGIGALLVGGLGALYGGLGVANAIQNAMNTAWAVPKNSRPNPIKARGRSLVLLLTIGGAVLVTTVLTAVSNALGTFSQIGIVAGTLVINVVVFVLGFQIATARDLTWREVAPGAIAAAVVWELLQKFGATYVQHVVKNSSDTNATFAIVLGLIAFIYVAATAVMFCVEVNVVRVEHLWPRALLTPLTDNVDLTAGDKKVYTRSARAQRNKGFEHIDVHFAEHAAHAVSDPDHVEQR